MKSNSTNPLIRLIRPRLNRRWHHTLALVPALIVWGASLAPGSIQAQTTPADCQSCHATEVSALANNKHAAPFPSCAAPSLNGMV